MPSTTTTSYTTDQTNIVNGYVGVEYGHTLKIMDAHFAAGVSIVAEGLQVKGLLKAAYAVRSYDWSVGTEQNNMTSAVRLAKKYGTAAKFDAAVEAYNDKRKAGAKPIKTIGGADRALLKQAKVAAPSAGDQKDAAVKYLAGKFTAAQIDAICAAAKASLKK